MNCDPIIIDDDGCDTDGIIDITKTNSISKASNDNSIVSNGNVITKSNARNNVNVIEIDDSEETPPNRLLYDVILTENKLLVIFIEKCFSLDNSEDMLKIINKTLLPIYKEMDPEFKKSHKFDRLLSKIIERLDREPNRKFTHIKCFFDTLKMHKVRKRVNFTTLATNLNATKITASDTSQDKTTTCNSKKRKSTSDSVEKKQKGNVIDLDNDQESVIDLDVDHTDSDVIIIDSQSVNQNESSDKENHTFPNKDTTMVENRSETVKPNSNNKKFNNTHNLKERVPDNKCKGITKINFNRNIIADSKSNRKSQTMELEVVEVNETSGLEKKIEDIEREIAFHKRLIAQWEVQEVIDDSNCSAYLMTDKFKAVIVNLYKQLCELTGHQPIKRREVRFQVAPGHRAGPVRLLEEYLNANIGENGEPPFPDFTDVLTCVVAADRADGLEWSAARVMNEANALFTRCGRALQKRRQEREWRDLLSRVTEESHDPADDDPELLARLEENKRIAMKKEEDILQRFIELENERKYSISNRKLPNSDTRESAHLDNEEYENAPPEEDSERETEATGSINYGITYNPEESCKFKDNTLHGAADLEVDNEQYANSNSEEDSEPETEATSSINCVITDYNEKLCDIKDNPLDGQVASHNKGIKEGIVKKEPEDISMLLSGLGDNFTSTIIDIEDPFLVIEISSDSESEDEQTPKNAKDGDVLSML